jgi:nicotinamidase/pyrazinamidase
MKFTKTDALLVVDVQNDFCPGGALAVSTGDAIAKTMTAVAKAFAAQGFKIFATKDWHPAGHSSFVARGGPWPIHCVQDTHGSEFHPNLLLPEGTEIVHKGTSMDKDAYSGFLDSDLEERLRAAKIERVFVGGLATDYCVLNTVIDALALGLETYVIADAIGAVDAEPGDGLRALHLMQASGAKLTAAADITAS